ncbi:hypothetical protein [Erythrobacter sp. AP23]|uniref:hypothetical protein n=1 Tax=Erythrobacter sp. AP23 TaxID=499656 RepID=UPI00076C51AE|nr:hypothetical protein [Erythrobacter sp. AP23]KWV93913.1 hypothetical protein ASS64_13570 [Erythrobacter sp. AP23]
MDLKELIAILIADVAEAKSRLQKEDTQTARRELIRAQFAAIEGLVWLARQHIAGVAREMDKLTEDEASALSEQSISIGQNGKITIQRKFIPTAAAIRFLARLARRICHEPVLELTDAGWSRLSNATQIRNRITHPKRSSDMEIEERDLADSEVAFAWCFESLIIAMERVTLAFRDEVEGIGEVLRLLNENDPTAWAHYQAAMTDDLDR